MSTTDRDHLHRWVTASEVVPGFVVRLPYGKQAVLEVDKVEAIHEEMGLIMVLHGWLTEPDNIDGRQVTNRQRVDSPLWLIDDLRDVIAY